MLLRFYRITDKLGLVIIKSLTSTGQYALDGISIAVEGMQGGASGFLGALIRILLGIWRIIITILRWIWRGINAILIRFGILRNAGTRTTQSVLKSGSATAKRTMARRAERRSAQQEMERGIVEDPLRTRNRALSILVLLLGFVLVGAIIWATSIDRESPVAVVAEADDVRFAPDVQPSPTIVSIINTPVPTATTIAPVLQVRGSLAYVVRERGQTDIWVVNVGSSNPIRLTNDPEDERDPAWSPDGRRLAYASHKDGNWEIYVDDLVTGESTRLTYDLSFQANPSWSPDGAFLVYESYQGNNLDLYIMPVDGSELPIRLTENAAPDFSPAWSPDGRRIAFTSWRGGNQDIYIFSLDDPRDAASVNITNTAERDEDYAAWSPEGELLAYSALDEGLEKVFVKPASDPDAVAQALERGRTPTWSPDGNSLVFAVDSVDSTHLVASPFSQTGVATEIIPTLPGANSPTWTLSPLPAPLVNSGGVGEAIASELYIEQEVDFGSDPPFRLDTLIDVDAPNAVLSDRVNDSFNALREQTVQVVGYDFLGELEDAFWRIDRPPQPGEDRRNWHMTGRAFAINRNLIAGFPPPIEVVREDIGVNTFWRVYVRVTDNAQNGQLGEPLRRMPWDFASRNQGDVEAYDAGGRLRTEIPEGYYVDLTQLVRDYGWDRMPAGRDWRANFNSINFWMFRKSGGLDWYEAMREIYTEAQLGGFAPTATPLPSVLATEQAGA